MIEYQNLNPLIFGALRRALCGTASGAINRNQSLPIGMNRKKVRHMRSLIAVAATLAFVFGSRPARAGDPYSIEWATQFGTTGNDSGRSVTTDVFGNVYVTGYTTGNLNGQPNAGQSDAFLVKFSASGSTLWTKLIGTSIGDVGLSVSVDAVGNSFIAGRTRLPGSNGDLNGFVGKLAPDGTSLWLSEFGTSAHDQALRLAVDSGGDIYVSGYSVGNLDGEVNSGGDDAFLRKLDSNGILQWTRLLGTSADERAEGIAIDSTGNIYIGGFTDGNLSSELNNGGRDMFLAKYNSAGMSQWTRLLGTASTEGATAVRTDMEGNVYLAGHSDENLDGQIGNGYADAVLAKYDGSGVRHWTRLLGSGLSDDAYDIAVDGATGDVFMTGWTYGDLAATNQGTTDMFLTKWNSSGNVAWSQQFGTSASDVGDGICVDSFGSVYVTGESNLALFGPDAGNQFENDAFLVMFTPEPASAATLFMALAVFSLRRFIPR